jgi:hypothetical protein
MFVKQRPDDIKVWSNAFSECLTTGPIVQFLTRISGGRVSILVSDGLAYTPNHSLFVYSLNDFEIAPQTGLGVLCTRGIKDPRLILMPLDDESFEGGVVHTVSSRVALPRWEDRKPIAFWRGCLSGGLAPTLRTRVVWELRENVNADVKLTRIQNIWSAEHRGQVSDESFYTHESSLDEHVQHKYIFILDGNCIASALQWVFASGSVPILVTHPDNDWWFKSYLKPMENYVPIKYDLSDLNSKIEWLVQNDDQARQIASRALDLARTVLSSEFQKEYLRKEIERVSQTN